MRKPEKIFAAALCGLILIAFCAALSGVAYDGQTPVRSAEELIRQHNAGRPAFTESETAALNALLPWYNGLTEPRQDEFLRRLFALEPERRQAYLERMNALTPELREEFLDLGSGLSDGQFCALLPWLLRLGDGEFGEQLSLLSALEPARLDRFAALIGENPGGADSVAYFRTPMNGRRALTADAEQWRGIEWQVYDYVRDRSYTVAAGPELSAGCEMAKPMFLPEGSGFSANTALFYCTGVKTGEPAAGRQRAGAYLLRFDPPAHTEAAPPEPEISAYQTVEPTPDRQARTAGGKKGGADEQCLEVVYVYKDENDVQQPIAPGWRCDNPDGTTSYTVTFHVIAGYKATLDDTEQTLYTFEPAGGVYDPTSITVVYCPQDVNYSVKVFREKLDGNYEELKAETKQAKTGSEVDMDELCDSRAEEGFGSPYYYEVPRVKGDGSTVAEIYMDCEYFLMDFDLGEGAFGVEPIYKKYGAEISVGTPTRPGYTFTGWELDGVTAEIPGTMPSDNTKYTAGWSENTDTGYSVVYWYENADDDDYSVAGTGTASGRTGETVTSEGHKDTNFAGRDSGHFTYNADKGESVTISGDGTTVVNVYYTRNVYTLTFTDGNSSVWTATDTEAKAWTDGGTDDDHRPKWDEAYTWTASDSSASQDYTCTVASLKSYLEQQNADPQEGDGVEYEYVSSVKYSQGFFGIGESWKETKKTASFVFHDGEWYVGEKTNTVCTITAKYGADIHENFPIPGYEGYWWKVPSNNVGLVQGNYILSQDIMLGQNLTFPGTEYGTDAKLHYYVEVLPEETVTRTYDGKNFKLYKLIPTEKTGKLTEAEEFHPIKGFTKWKSDPSFGSGGSVAPKDDNYFYYTRNNYNLIFKSGGSEAKRTEQVLYEASLLPHRWAPAENEIVDMYPTALEPGAYRFDGWSVSEVITDSTKMTDEMWERDIMPANDRILYARWIPVTHSVTFRPDESDEIPETAAALVPHGSLIPEDKIPSDPDKQGFTFVGWFYREDDGEHAFKPDETPVKKDLALYAKWKAEAVWHYTVKYVLDGIDSGAPVFVAEPASGVGEPESTFTIIAKTGYSAGPPEHQSELLPDFWKFYTPVCENMEITLDEDNKEFIFHYTEDEARIEYAAVDADLGSVSLEEEKIGKVTGSGMTGSVPQPAEGCKFIGWYSSEDCAEDSKVPEDWVREDGSLVPERTLNAGIPDEGTSTLWVFEDAVYYAKFDQLVTIGYEAKAFDFKGAAITDTAGGAVSPAEDGPMGAESGTPGGSFPAAEPGFTFKGWYSSENCAEDSEVPEEWVDEVGRLTPHKTDGNKYGDAVYYAKFEEEKVSIKYKAVGEGSVFPEAETIGKVTGAPKGSVPTPVNGYAFVGWYKDADCKKLVTGSWTDGETGKLTPEKEGDPALYNEAAYYAKFVKIPVIVIKKVLLDEPYSADDIFVFEITIPKKGGGEYTINASIAAKDLDEGYEYQLPISSIALDQREAECTIKEDTSWGWRYSLERVTVQAGRIGEVKELDPVDNAVTNIPLSLDVDKNPTIVTFTNKLVNKKWLNSSSQAVNICAPAGSSHVGTANNTKGGEAPRTAQAISCALPKTGAAARKALQY